MQRKSCIFLLVVLMMGYCGIVNAGGNSSITVVTALTEEAPASSKPEVIEQDAEIYKISFPEEILFDFDKDRLSDEAKRILNQVAEKLGSHSEIRLRVEGNGDDVGANVYNIQLGLRRSQSVINYLVNKQGIPRNRLIKTSLGEENQTDGKTPGNDVDIETKRKKNRVVKFNIEDGWYVFTQPKASPPPPPSANNGFKTGLLNFQFNVPVYQFPVLNLQLPTIPRAMDRKWTLKQRILLSTIVGLATGAGSSAVTWLRDVHNEDIRTSTGGHYESYRNINAPEFIAGAIGLGTGFGATFWLSGHFWRDGDDGSFKFIFGNKGDGR